MLVVTFDNGFKYGIIPGKDEFIVTQSDFIHFTVKNDEPVELLVAYDKTEGETDKEGWTAITIKDVTKTFTLSELLALAVETKLGNRDDEFGHYWGIKSRVAYNYHLLSITVREIGAGIKLPEWGEK